jgi:hypothetical protein
VRVIQAQFISASYIYTDLLSHILGSASDTVWGFYQRDMTCFDSHRAYLCRQHPKGAAVERQLYGLRDVPLCEEVHESLDVKDQRFATTLLARAARGGFSKVRYNCHPLELALI